MEDDEKVRRVAREMLTASGYEVLEASSGEEALSVYERHRGEIQLLLSDVVLPGMRGTELAKHLNASDRQVKAVFMSGYLDARTAEDFPGDSAFVQKPLQADTLLEAVRRRLHS